MKKPFIYPILFLLGAFFIGMTTHFMGCDVLSTSPTATMSIKNIQGPLKKPCGGFSWTVQFLLKSPSAKGGYFVQKISIQRTIEKKCPKQYNDLDVTYYEAWPVSAGKTVTTYADKGDVNDDTFFNPSMTQSEGNSNFSAQVKFFENITLPADFKANNRQTFAGILPSTKSKPAFWDAADALDHKLVSTWDCCDDSAHTLVVTPDFSKLIKPAKNPKGGKFFEQLEGLKAWTDPEGYDENDQYMLLESAMQIAQMTDAELVAGVTDYAAYYLAYVDELSKLYVMLRYVMDVPENLAEADALSFGGWIISAEEISGGTVNMLWPLAWDGNMLKLSHPFEGYVGAGYDAVGELAYFMEHFNRREF